MGTYPNINTMVFEANTEDSSPHFVWIPPSFFSAKKIDLNPVQKTQMEPKPALAAIPINSVGPTTEPRINFETKPAQIKKKNPSTKSSTEIPFKILRPEQLKKKPEGNVEKKNWNTVSDKHNLDFSGVPPPFCSCTGISRGCYRWGRGGWQSSCCNTSLSEYPLPMRPSRPGIRVAGRKMSNGAYGKLLFRLAVEGYDLSNPVDLKDHWARHGTNKFVTIK